MHGGAPGSGGPKGRHNGNYKHGRYTTELIASRRWLRQFTRDVRALTKRLRQPLRSRGLSLIPTNVCHLLVLSKWTQSSYLRDHYPGETVVFLAAELEGGGLSLRVF
jgi:hypothetical protein